MSGAKKCIGTTRQFDRLKRRRPLVAFFCVGGRLSFAPRNSPAHRPKVALLGKRWERWGVTWASTERVIVAPDTCAVRGRVVVQWRDVLWVFGHGALGLVGIWLFPSLDALAVFVVLTAVTVCAGHSVGMHRLLIHRSFATLHWLEYLLVWLGVLVGMAGPMGMIRKHDMRDWHQRQSVCPDHAAHRAGFWRDAWWQLVCAYRLDHPPQFEIEERVLEDRVYDWMERWWRWQNLPLALALFLLGGWAWVLWGVSLRIFVSLVGHWAVGHFAHRKGAQTWVIEGLPVQGYNLPGLGWLTFGENWHGNHHAFPFSAKLGLEPGEADLGYRLIQVLAAIGLVWDVKLPGSEPERAGLRRL